MLLNYKKKACNKREVWENTQPVPSAANHATSTKCRKTATSATCWKTCNWCQQWGTGDKDADDSDWFLAGFKSGATEFRKA